MLRKSGTQRRQPALWWRCRSLRQIKQVHTLMVLRGFLSDPSALRLIFASSVGVRGGTAPTRLVFDRIPHPNRFMYNTLIRSTAHGDTDTPRDTVSIYARMSRHSADCGGVRPDKLTFLFVLRACAAMSTGETGAQVHAHIVKAGCESDAFVRNTLIGMHTTCGDLGATAVLFDGEACEDAMAWSAMISGLARRGDIAATQELFDESPVKDLVSWDVMIMTYAKLGDMATARQLFTMAPDRDVVSWNAMISGYVRCGSHKQAMELFEQMQAMGEKPDTVTMSACADFGGLDDGHRLHRFLSGRFSRIGPTTVLGNVLIGMYAKCGSMMSALEVFRLMQDKNVSTWNSIIGGLALHAHVTESIDVFQKMLQGNVKPDEITFVAVLVACSHVSPTLVSLQAPILMLSREELHHLMAGRRQSQESLEAQSSCLQARLDVNSTGPTFQFRFTVGPCNGQGDRHRLLYKAGRDLEKERNWNSNLEPCLNGDGGGGSAI